MLRTTQRENGTVLGTRGMTRECEEQSGASSNEFVARSRPLLLALRNLAVKPWLSPETAKTPSPLGFYCQSSFLVQNQATAFFREVGRFNRVPV